MSFHPLSCGEGGSEGPGQEIVDVPGRGVEHRRLDIGSDRWVIERQRRAIQALPVGLEAVAVDNLPVLQLKLDQVNVDGMGIFRQVLEVPRLGRADLRELSDVLIEMLPVDEHRHGLAMSLSCSFRVKSFGLPMFWVSTSVGMVISLAGSGFRMHGRRVLHLESHHLAVVFGSTGSPPGKGSLAVFFRTTFVPGAQVREVDQDVRRSASAMSTSVNVTGAGK